METINFVLSSIALNLGFFPNLSIKVAFASLIIEALLILGLMLSISLKITQRKIS